MKRKRTILCLLALLVILSACGNSNNDTPTEQTGVPSRMVEQIDVAIHPEDDDFARSYTDMEKMSPILRILRDMDTTHVPEEEPSITDGQTYYTITATYANGESRVYYLLSHKFMRIDDGTWCEIDNSDAMDLIQYIRDTPDTEEAEETDPSETSEETLPEESTEAETENTDETTASEA